MVHIRYKHTVSKFRIAMKGHANYAEGGKDIVCASISTICNMLILAVDEARLHDEIKIKSVQVSPGNVQLCFQYNKSDSRVRYIADLVIKSYRELAEDYPDNIQIESD